MATVIAGAFYLGGLRRTLLQALASIEEHSEKISNNKRLTNKIKDETIEKAKEIVNAAEIRITKHCDDNTLHSNELINKDLTCQMCCEPINKIKDCNLLRCGHTIHYRCYDIYKSKFSPFSNC